MITYLITPQKSKIVYVSLQVSQLTKIQNKMKFENYFS